MENKSKNKQPFADENEGPETQKYEEYSDDETDDYEEYADKDADAGQEADDYEGYPSIRSISDAERLLEEWSPDDDKDIPGYILSMIPDDDDNGDKIFGSADEYHNLSAEFARNHLHKQAEYVAYVGAKKYRMNTDLLADIVKYGSQAQDWSNCEAAYGRLTLIPPQRWNWRAFTFVIDYLMDKLEAIDPQDAPPIEEEIKKHVENYKKLKDERAWVAESEYYERIGDRDAAKAALWDGVNTIVVVPQVCLKLADMLLEDGEYENTVKVAAKGIRSTAQDQPSASIGYLFYVSALAKDAMIHNEAADYPCYPDKGFNNTEKVKSSLLDYKIATKLLSNRIYLNQIAQRRLILQEMSGIKDEDEGPNEEKLKALKSLLEMIKDHDSDE